MFRQGPIVVRIEKVFSQGPNTTEYDLFVSEAVIPADRTRVLPGAETDYIGDFLTNRLEFEDAEGHPLRWLLLGQPAVSTTSDEVGVQTFVTGAAPPARLLVYRLHRFATEIAFEFRDVPSP